MPVVARVAFCPLAWLQTQIKARDNGENEPLELQQGVALPGTKGPESHHRVSQLLASLVELGVHKTIVLEYLTRSNLYCMYVCMYTALITHQYVMQMGWKKLHLHES